MVSSDPEGMAVAGGSTGFSSTVRAPDPNTTRCHSLTVSTSLEVVTTLPPTLAPRNPLLSRAIETALVKVRMSASVAAAPETYNQKPTAPAGALAMLIVPEFCTSRP